MIHVFQVLGDHVGFASVAPIGKVCKGKHKGMLLFIMVLEHVVINVATTSDNLTFEAYPVFFVVTAGVTWSLYRDVFKFFHRCDEFIRNAVGTLFYRFHGKESH